VKHFLLFIFIAAGLCLSAQNITITGILKDAESGHALPFGSIALPGTSKGVNSNGQGTFSITIPDNVKPLRLIASYIGYATDTLLVSASQHELVILLKHEHEKLDEVVVTGASKATLMRENPLSVSSVSLKALERSNESNLVEALVKHVPGLNTVKTGPNISKPFIRGLGYNRVLTLYDGVRQEGQQWGDEHGLEVDAYNMQRAEVIKGPASLLYGSDALAGVVSFIPYVPNEKDSVLKLKFISEYQSNNGLSGNGLRLGYSTERWLFAFRGSYRLAKNYSNAIDGPVYNTGFNEKNLALLAGCNSRKGYTQLNLTLYDNLQGIPDGSRDSATRQFTQQVYEGADDDIKHRPLVSNAALHSYALSPLHQHIQHYRLYANSHYQLGKGEADALIAIQQNTRREYNHPTDVSQAGMYVLLNTLNYGLRYNAPKIHDVEISGGINGMYQSNQNKDATDFPIPDYQLLDAGAYLYAKWKRKRWTVSGGFRYDLRYLSGNNFYVRMDSARGFMEQASKDESGAELQFPSFNKMFSGLSASAGITCKLNQALSLKINVARGYRAPNITEFAANGLDPGAHVVYLGNRNFSPEFSLQEDVGMSCVLKDVSVSFSVFNNHVFNYIYLSQLTNEHGEPVVSEQGNKTFLYQQAAAQLYGLEANVDLHPRGSKGFSLFSDFSLLYGFNRKDEYKGQGIYGAYLPFIPPLKWLSGISQEISLGSQVLRSVTIKAELDYNGAQNRYLALYNTETSNAAYCLINTGIQAELRCRKKSIQLQAQINNLLDAVYQSNLSRLKYFEYYTASPNGRYGLYGMGRNVCVKVIVEI